MGDTVIRMRLLRDDPEPPSPDGTAVRFGLQDNKEQIYEGKVGADGKLAFEFELDVAEAPDQARPVFTGRFAMGRREDRFVYLSWQRRDGCGYVNRIKVRLCDIDWTLVKEAQAKGRCLEADASGRGAGGGRVPVEWRIAD